MTNNKIANINTVYKYKAVEDNERHPDYQTSGVAPIIGHYLNEIAQEDSDRGALAEGILRTGDHNLLPILNDRLVGGDNEETHPLAANYDVEGDKTSGPIDWHHAPRAIAIDKIIQDELGPTPVSFAGTTVELAPTHPPDLINRWLSGQDAISRRYLTNRIKKHIDNANLTDVLHSVTRLALNHEGHNRINPYVTANTNNRLRQLRAKVDKAHEYTDTRPKDKRKPLLYSMKKKSQSWVGKKIALLKGEGYPYKQAIAIALSMAGRSKKQKQKYNLEQEQGLIPLPDITQQDDYSCEAACAMAVGKYYGVGPNTLEEWKTLLGVTKENPIDFQRIAKYFSECGLDVQLECNMSIDDLMVNYSQGKPTICLIEEYAVPSKEASYEYGHVVAVVGVGLGQVFVFDPSIDNVLANNDCIQTAGLSPISYNTWMAYWNAKDGKGHHYSRLGLTVGPLKAKYSVTKAGSKGMIDQISPHAAFGEWRKPNQFSTSLQFVSGKKKQQSVSPFLTAKSKDNAPANPFDTEKKQHQLSLEYIRTLKSHIKKLKKTKKKPS